MTVPTKKEIKEYQLRLNKIAGGFKLTLEDVSNLYDLFYMISPELDSTLKLNKMDKWAIKFHNRLDELIEMAERKK